MSELMEECHELIMCNERRSISCRLSEVTYDADERTILYAILNSLTTELCHPCSTSLACAWEEVSIEKCKVASVCIENLIYLYILLIYRNIIELLEADAIKAACKTEYCIDAALKLEVRLKFLCIKRILCLLITL